MIGLTLALAQPRSVSIQVRQDTRQDLAAYTVVATRASLAQHGENKGPR